MKPFWTIFGRRDSISNNCAADLQSQGAKSFDESWKKLLEAIEAKGKVLQGAH